MKHSLIIALLFCAAFNANGQLLRLIPGVGRFLDTLSDKLPSATLELGAALQPSTFLEFGLIHATDGNGDDEGTDGTMFGYKIAYVIAPFQTHIIQAPEIAAEANIFFLTLRLSSAYYSGIQDIATHYDWRFTPEVGVTVMGVVTVCYGWNIPLLKDRLTTLSRHRWSVNINFVDIDL